MSMTYNSLIAQVANTLERADLTLQIPNFISQAEQRISRESKTLGLEQYVSGAFTVGLQKIPKPARWRRTISFNYGTPSTEFMNQFDYTQLELRDYEYCRLYSPNASQTGKPVYYSDYGYSTFLVVPAPDFTYPFELAYLELPDPLTVTNQTNWLTDYAPDVLYYATLLEAVAFLKNEEKLTTWTTLYKAALSSLNQQDDMRVEDRISNRSSD
jgi:hypothetical protein